MQIGINTDVDLPLKVDVINNLIADICFVERSSSHAFLLHVCMVE